MADAADPWRVSRRSTSQSDAGTVDVYRNRADTTTATTTADADTCVKCVEHARTALRLLFSEPYVRAPRRRLRRRMSDLKQALDRARAGGPERHHEKSAQQGKLPVRERIARLLDAGSFAEEALLANWEQDGFGADGVVTGMGTIAGRQVARDGQRPDGQGRLLGPEDRREDHPDPGAGARSTASR